MPIPANLQNTGGYSSGNANNSYTSGGQGQTAQKKGQVNGFQNKAKAKPLQMADFKKFKKLNLILVTA